MCAHQYSAGGLQPGMSESAPAEPPYRMTKAQKKKWRRQQKHAEDAKACQSNASDTSATPRDQVRVSCQLGSDE